MIKETIILISLSILMVAVLGAWGYAKTVAEFNEKEMDGEEDGML